eukprot:scaffold1587_cov62-Phaeocystis_antarctica.AAC.2
MGVSVLLVDKLAVRSRNQKGEGVIPAAPSADCRSTFLWFNCVGTTSGSFDSETHQHHGAESSSSVLASRRGSPPEAGRAAAKDVHALVELVAEGARHPGDGPL